MESTIKKATGLPVAFLFLPHFVCSLEILVHQFFKLLSQNLKSKINYPTILKLYDEIILTHVHIQFSYLVDWLIAMLSLALLC